MLFDQLQGLTGLPVERLRRRFRNEQVLAVLPARIEKGTTDTLLVAAASSLAIITVDPGRPSGRWMTQWVAWDDVRLSDRTSPWMSSSDDEYQLFIEVGSLVFETRLPGEAGRKALRDFVVAVQSGAATAAR